ncbi:deoxyribodipyrimidine photo-lyase [Hyphomicrobiales bacterium]|nr:deoxyribodipyrimidine photo-lyase [Hyphomicrobiales bacterium]
MNVIWFKRDLRVWDNEAFSKACESGPVIPLYIFEPELWSQNDLSYRHYQFLIECLDDLKYDIEKLGQELIIRSGNALEIFQDINQQFDISELWSHQETWNYWTFKRDSSVRKWTDLNNIEWNEPSQNGVIRALKDRDGWSKNWHTKMKVDNFLPPEKLNKLNIKTEEIPKPKDISLNRIDFVNIQKGGRREGLKLLDSFLLKRGKNYSREMSSPLTATNSCSRLSAHLSFGSLSIKEVFQATEAKKKELKELPKELKGNWIKSLNSFLGRLRWHCHFIQKLEDEPEIEFKNMHTSYDALRINDFKDIFFEKWKTGKTGYPMVDASMRSLIATGWLNFRMRAMLMSFASYHLWLPWQITSRYLATLFTDYEPGIHYSQSQMQSGTTGINSVRIYNPIKQGLDQDPDAVFIRKWLPELKKVSKENIHMPWKDAENMNGYPHPIVDESEARTSAASKIYKLRKDKIHKLEANKVYIKHGSRKPRSKKTKSKNKLKKSDVQMSLF